MANQAQYADGSTPPSPPTYEPATMRVDREIVQEITAGRTLAGELQGRLADVTDRRSAVGTASGRVSVSRRTTDDGLRLFVDCPAAVETDRVEGVIERIADELDAGRIGKRLLESGRVDVEARTRPTERLEADCQHTLGRFADARYRKNGIAMGAAVRSETVGKIASTGFRGLRNGRAVIVTTAHTFEEKQDHDPAALRGIELYQSRQPHTIGRCYAAGDTVDVAAVAVETDSYPSRFLADPGGNSYDDRPIVGTASWSALEAAHAEGRPIYKQGAVSGRCAGRITELTEAPDGHRELGVDTHSAGGDSGGPYFLETDEGLLVAGIHKGVRSESGQRRAIFVGSVLDTLDIDIY
ncbi:MAG: hypothetical protein U9O06_01990 [Euryarchaeota archaeon]|nr:hypothetical protein [Euryarchaeota archaeon]